MVFKTNGSNTKPEHKQKSRVGMNSEIINTMNTEDLKSLAEPGGIENKKLVEEKTSVPNGKTVHNFDDNTSKQINNNEQQKDGDLLDNVYPV